MINKDHEYYYSDTMHVKGNVTYSKIYGIYNIILLKVATAIYRLDKPHLTHTLDWFCSNSSGSLIAACKAWFKTLQYNNIIHLFYYVPKSKLTLLR